MRKRLEGQGTIGMKIFDNVTEIVRDDIEQTIRRELGFYRYSLLRGA